MFTEKGRSIKRLSYSSTATKYMIPHLNELQTCTYVCKTLTISAKKLIIYIINVTAYIFTRHWSCSGARTQPRRYAAGCCVHSLKALQPDCTHEQVTQTYPGICVNGVTESESANIISVITPPGLGFQYTPLSLLSLMSCGSAGTPLSKSIHHVTDGLTHTQTHIYTRTQSLNSLA